MGNVNRKFKKEYGASKKSTSIETPKKKKDEEVKLEKYTNKSEMYTNKSKPINRNDKGSIDANSNLLETAGMNSVNLDIFEHPDMTCSRPRGDQMITNLCSATTRLCTAAEYYNAISTSKVLDDEMKRALFVEFNEVVYQYVLEDTNHFVKKHSDDIQRVHAEWTQQYGVPKCSVSKCTKMARHYRRGRRVRKRKDQYAVYSFYEALYDRLHHFIFHLYDIGMRVEKKSINLNQNGDEDKEVDSAGVSVNELFAAERDQIKSRREESNVDLERFEEENNKFTIQSVSAMKGAVTLMDALFQKLMENKGIQREALHRLSCFVVDNSFDSECMEMDLEDFKDSNICAQVQSQIAVDLLADFIQMRRRSFSTGFIFNYWNENDKMFVKPIHNNLKEEVIESGYLNAAEWMEFVKLKAQKYMKTKGIKQMKAGRAEDGTLTWTGQFKKGDPVTMEHLYAVILYCDCGILCTTFSATFRLRDAFEEIESLIKRHSHFAFFGKLLVEMVLDFGITGYGNKNNQGPFFCGLNCVLNIGSFAIQMKGPCSTSTVREVALNFAKADGVILKLDNKGTNLAGPCVQTFFDCSWISNFYEESERLWIAGTKCLRIVSIVLVRSAKDYRKALKALFLFDAMISGVGITGMNIKAEAVDKQLISMLIELELNGGFSEVTDFDFYLKNEWKLFLRSKEEINLYLNAWPGTFELLLELVVFKRVNNRGNAAIGNANILRPEWLSIFPELKRTRINTFGDRYKFQMDELLKVMDSVPHSVTLMVEDYNEWIKNAVTDKVRADFAEKGWNLEYHETQERNENGENMSKLVMKHNEKNE